MTWHDTAYAKINLALHVRERRDDGYHTLETIFAFAQDGDAVRAEPSDRLTLTMDGPYAAGLSCGADNLVLRAAQALADAANVTDGAAIHLTKNLPVASGIGGGSADAAATLRLLNRMWGLHWPIWAFEAIAIKLGADVPACLLSQTCFGNGRGDAIAAIEIPLSGVPILLVNPNIALSTAAVFAGWDGLDRGPLRASSQLPDIMAARNDLQAPAIVLVPEIDIILLALQSLNPNGLNRMSGSGGTCFAVFDSVIDRDSAQASLTHDYPAFWTLASTLV